MNPAQPPLLHVRPIIALRGRSHHMKSMVLGQWHRTKSRGRAFSLILAPGDGPSGIQIRPWRPSSYALGEREFYLKCRGNPEGSTTNTRELY